MKVNQPNEDKIIRASLVYTMIIKDIVTTEATKYSI